MHEDLVLRAQRGDRAAFADLYRRYSSCVHGVALAHAPSPDDVPDIVQDTFLQAMNKLDTLTDLSAFGAWIATIARNNARMTRRRGIRLVELPDDVPDAAHGEPELDGGFVLAAIKELPEAFREPLLLRLVEGLGGAEIAERLGMTHGSVRVNLHRGMTQLRERMGGQHE